MIIELTDAKRYELEKDNVVSILLAAARSEDGLTAKSIASILNIDSDTTDRLITALRTENIIK